MTVIESNLRLLAGDSLKGNIKAAGFLFNRLSAISSGRAALADLNDALSHDNHTKLPTIDPLAQFFTMYGRLILSEFGMCLALVSDRSLNPQSRRPLRSLKKQFELTVQRILDEDREDGTIRGDDPKMFIFAGFGAFNWAPSGFRIKAHPPPMRFHIFRDVAT